MCRKERNPCKLLSAAWAGSTSTREHWRGRSSLNPSLQGAQAVHAGQQEPLLFICSSACWALPCLPLRSHEEGQHRYYTAWAEEAAVSLPFLSSYSTHSGCGNKTSFCVHTLELRSICSVLQGLNFLRNWRTEHSEPLCKMTCLEAAWMDHYRQSSLYMAQVTQMSHGTAMKKKTEVFLRMAIAGLSKYKDLCIKPRMIEFPNLDGHKRTPIGAVLILPADQCLWLPCSRSEVGQTAFHVHDNQAHQNEVQAQCFPTTQT